MRCTNSFTMLMRALVVTALLVSTSTSMQPSFSGELQESVTSNNLETTSNSEQPKPRKRRGINRLDAAIAKKTYVIIGASSGFGRGVAEKVGASGANVVLAARRTNVLEDIATRIRKSGGQAFVVTTDISRAEDVERLAKEAKEKFGTVDVWINDTGIGALGRFEEIPVADEARLIDVNLKGIIYGSHAALKIFKKQGYGTLINLGSIESKIPIAYQAAYAASKAGVLGLDRAIAQELRIAKTKRIRVSTVMPWAVDTPWWDHAANYSGGEPQMLGMDGPQQVVDAIVRDSIHPKDELMVGLKAKAAGLAHQLMPNITEHATANVSYKYQMKTAPPAPPTDGSIFTPMQTGTGINGHVRERMKQKGPEKKQQP